MQKKPNYKVMAVCWIISGIVSVILGIILLNVASEASPYSRQERDAAQLINIVSVAFIVSGIGEFIGGCVSAGKAANESSNNNGVNSGNNYNSDYWRKNSGSIESYGVSMKQNGYIANSGFWVCPKCGKENANYVGTCGCGERKPAITAAPNVSTTPNISVAPNVSANSNFWQCTKCGKINANYVGTCGCGERRDAPKPTYAAPEEREAVVTTPVVEPAVAQPVNKEAGNMFCPYCGSTVKSGHVFCRECGKKLD